MLMFARVGLCLLLILGTVTAAAWADDDPIFSGPQAGEKLPEFKLKTVIPNTSEEPVAALGEDTDQPLLLIFFHAKTRPAFGLTNTLTRFAASRKADGLKSLVVFLTDDAVETEKWLNQVQKHFTPGAVHGVSPDGHEGPGAYGLNRNVALTVVVAKAGKVAANFALVQPSEQVDGPKIMKAVVDMLGGGEVPPLAKFSSRAMMARNGGRPNDGQLRALLAPVINKQASAEDVAAAAKKVEAACEKQPALKKRIGQIARTIIQANRLSNYGTDEAQGFIKKWAEEFK